MSNQKRKSSRARANHQSLLREKAISHEIFIKSFNRAKVGGVGLSVLLLTNFACRPVMTIGWQEIAILVVIVLILAGPALFKLYKRIDEFQNWKESRNKKDQKD